MDVDQMIGAVRRTLNTVELNGKPARQIVAERIYSTDIANLWDALTNPERLSKWFMHVDGDLTPGSRYQLKGNASGSVEECNEPTSFRITWEYGGEVSWVHVTLAERGAETMLTLQHIAHVPDEFWNQFGPGAVGVGWDLGLMGLTTFLESNVPVDPQEVMIWQGTNEGHQFILGSSKGWAEASIADGTAPDLAYESADRTTRFYTGAG